MEVVPRTSVGYVLHQVVLGTTVRYVLHQVEAQVVPGTTLRYALAILIVDQGPSFIINRICNLEID